MKTTASTQGRDQLAQEVLNGTQQEKQRYNRKPKTKETPTRKAQKKRTEKAKATTNPTP